MKRACGGAEDHKNQSRTGVRRSQGMPYAAQGLGPPHPSAASSANREPSSTDLGVVAAAGCLVFLRVALLCAACAPGLLAQVTANLEVSSTSIGVNDQLTVSITLSGSDLNTADQPDLSNIDGFRLVAGPSVSTQFQWINGRTSSSKSFSYVLLPVQPGDFTLGPFTISLGSTSVTTNSVQVKVVAGSAAPQARAQRRSPFAQRPTDLDEPDAQPGTVGEEVFVTAEPDRLRVYPGQQITLTYKVYTQLSISGLELKESPSLKGFWVEDIEVPRVPAPDVVQSRGRQYSVFVVKKQALFANAPGRLQIPSSTFALGVRVRTNDPFSFFNFGMTEPVYRRTAATEINVVAFPAAGKPAGFKNLSGHYTLAAKADKTEAKTGDAIALTVALSGVGNFNTVGDLDVPRLDDFKVFSSKSSVKSDRSGDQIQGTKTWEYVIVPQSPGAQTIPAFSIAYFDPDTERYATASTEPIAIRVARSATDSAMPQRSYQPSQRKLTRQGSDINFIKLAGGSVRDQSSAWYTGYWFYLLLLLPVAANIGIYCQQKYAARLAGNVALMRQRQASKRASAAFKTASKLLKAGKVMEFHSALAMALSHFLADRFGLPEIDLTREQIGERLSERGVATDTIAGVTKLLDRCDFARFAPSQVTAEGAQGLFEEAQQLVDRLEKSANR